MPPTRTRQAGLVLWPILWQCGRSPIPERIDRGLERVAGMWGGALQNSAMMSCRTTCPERSRGKWGISMRGRPPSARWRFVARRARRVARTFVRVSNATDTLLRTQRSSHALEIPHPIIPSSPQSGLDGIPGIRNDMGGVSPVLIRQKVLVCHSESPEYRAAGAGSRG